MAQTVEQTMEQAVDGALNEEIRDYWSGEAPDYSRGVESELNSPYRAVWRDLILSRAPDAGRRPLDILDAGCGPGFFPVVLGEAGHRVTGVDLAADMVACAAERVRAAGIDAELLQMDCQQLAFADGTFDLVISRNITWTLANPEQAYREWHRVLKPGGRVLVFDACWYRHLFDPELGAAYRAHEARIREQYGRGIHEHADQARGDALAEALFMSDKIRPQWDLDCCIRLGFRSVFADLDIGDRIWTARNRDLNRLTPPFLIGAEK